MTKYCYIVPKFTVLGLGRAFDKPTVKLLRGREIIMCLNKGKCFEVLNDGSIKNLTRSTYLEIDPKTITDFTTLPTVKDEEGNVIVDEDGNPKFPGTESVNPDTQPEVASYTVDNKKNSNSQQQYSKQVQASTVSNTTDSKNLSESQQNSKSNKNNK